MGEVSLECPQIPRLQALDKASGAAPSPQREALVDRADLARGEPRHPAGLALDPRLDSAEAGCEGGERGRERARGASGSSSRPGQEVEAHAASEAAANQRATSASESP